MTERLLRERNTDAILVKEEGGEVVYPISDFLLARHYDGIIRIRESEYQYINPSLGFLGHFNMETAGNLVGGTNALPRIVEPGYYDVHTGEEKLPLLSFERIYTAVCERCDEHLAYGELTAEHFRYSFTHIKDVDALKRVILLRYRESLHGVSDEEILLRGVAFTLLRFT